MVPRLLRIVGLDNHIARRVADPLHPGVTLRERSVRGVAMHIDDQPATGDIADFWYGNIETHLFTSDSLEASR
jgi:hypothetical protein